jgi:hypothetical protein
MKKKKKKESTPKRTESPTHCRYGSNDSPQPYYNEGKSIAQIEMDEGHGFWGNASSGYITDERLNNM